MCEMASYGMPVITSNIDICREILNGFDNVTLLENEAFSSKLPPLPGPGRPVQNPFDPGIIIPSELAFFGRIIAG